jgi:hypothetical protein
VRLVSPIGSATGGSGNLSDSLSNVARLAAHPKFVWVFNANCDETIIYNDPVLECSGLKKRRILRLREKILDSRAGKKLETWVEEQN